MPLITSLGSIGFLLASVSSYWHLDLLPASHPSQLLFVPQGLVMGLYGIVGSLLTVVFLDRHCSGRGGR